MPGSAGRPTPSRCARRPGTWRRDAAAAARPPRKACRTAPGCRPPKARPRGRLTLPPLAPHPCRKFMLAAASGGGGHGAMARTRRGILIGMAGIGLACPALRAAMAQEAWPSRPVGVIVPFPAGGTTDMLARLYGQRLTETLGQSILVE